jgi:hypothetical protein
VLALAHDQFAPIEWRRYAFGTRAVSILLSASHAARCVACQGVRSQPVPVALVGECSIPSTRYSINLNARAQRRGASIASPCPLKRDVGQPSLLKNVARNATVIGHQPLCVTLTSSPSDELVVRAFSNVVPGADQRLKLRERRVDLPGHGGSSQILP